LVTLMNPTKNITNVEAYEERGKKVTSEHTIIFLNFLPANRAHRAPRHPSRSSNPPTKKTATSLGPFRLTIKAWVTSSGASGLFKKAIV